MRGHQDPAEHFRSLIQQQPTRHDIATQTASDGEKLIAAQSELAHFLVEGAGSLALAMRSEGIHGDYFHEWDKPGKDAFGFIIRQRKAYGSRDYPFETYFQTPRYSVDHTSDYTRALVVLRDTGSLAIVGWNARRYIFANKYPTMRDWCNMDAFTSANDLPGLKSQVQKDLDAAAMKYGRGR